MNRYDLEDTLKTAGVYALTFGIIVLLAIGLGTLINHGNVKIEARCSEQGGQVLRTPGEVSRCLLPPSI
jgi:hypothetical protein